MNKYRQKYRQNKQIPTKKAKRKTEKRSTIKQIATKMSVYGDTDKESKDNEEDNMGTGTMQTYTHNQGEEGN